MQLLEKRNDGTAFYPCTKVVSDTEDGIASCSPEINRHVELALQGVHLCFRHHLQKFAKIFPVQIGHNTAIILLDVG